MNAEGITIYLNEKSSEYRNGKRRTIKASTANKQKVLEKRKVAKAKKKFDKYNDAEWEKTYFDKETGGYVATSRKRIETAYAPNKNGKPVKEKVNVFKVEQRMAKNFAKFGFQIEHLNEISGVSSPDARLRRHKRSIKVNGQYADFKSLESSTNIRKRVHKAVDKQGANFVMLEFTKNDTKFKSDVIRALDHLKGKGYHGYYYYLGENKLLSF